MSSQKQEKTKDNKTSSAKRARRADEEEEQAQTHSEADADRALALELRVSDLEAEVARLQKALDESEQARAELVASSNSNQQQSTTATKTKDDNNNNDNKTDNKNDNEAESTSDGRIAVGQWLDVLVVWDGEDGGPQLRALAPAASRAETAQALADVWNYEHPRDCPYGRERNGVADVRIRAYSAGERRPCATLFRARVQSAAAVADGEPDKDRSLEQFNMPDY